MLGCENMNPRRSLADRSQYNNENILKLINKKSFYQYRVSKKVSKFHNLALELLGNLVRYGW